MKTCIKDAITINIPHYMPDSFFPGYKKKACWLKILILSEIHYHSLKAIASPDLIKEKDVSKEGVYCGTNKSLAKKFKTSDSLVSTMLKNLEEEELIFPYKDEENKRGIISMIPEDPKDVKKVYFTIPRSIVQDDRLGWPDKLILSRINYISKTAASGSERVKYIDVRKDHSCYMLSKNLAKLLRISETRISQILKHLKELKLIEIYKDDANRRGIIAHIPEPQIVEKQLIEKETKNETDELLLPDPESELTVKLIRSFGILINNTSFKPYNTGQMEKFIKASQQFRKFYKDRMVIKKNQIEYLAKCLTKNYKDSGNVLHPGHLCGDYTWNILMPQFLEELGGM